MDKRVRINDAIRRLHVTQAQVDACPPITTFIRTYIRGGLKAALRVMRFCSGDEIVKAFLERYDAIPEGDRDKIPWEAVVVAAKIDANHLLGAIQFSLQQTSVSAVKFIALSHYPEIMKKQVQYAKDRTGERDRAAINMAMGFTPSPKPPTFIGKAIFGSPEAAKDDEDETDAPAPTFAMEDNINKVFPNSADTQQKLVPIRHRLTEGTQE